MKYLAKVKISEYSSMEMLFDTEKEAQIWAFNQDGLEFTVTPHRGRFSLLEIASIHMLEITDNRN